MSPFAKLNVWAGRRVPRINSFTETVAFSQRIIAATEAGGGGSTSAVASPQMAAG